MEKQNKGGTEQKNKFSKENDCGAAWKRTSKNGTSFLSLVVKIEGKKYSIIGFANKFKEPGSSQPDIRLYLEKTEEDVSGGAAFDLDGVGSMAGTSTQKKASSQSARPAVSKVEDAEDISDEEIPF